MIIQEIKAEETYAVRHAILRPNQPIEACAYPGDNAENTIHIGALLDGKVIGIASFYKESFDAFPENHQYRLRGMATLTEYRGMKIGQQLIHAAEEILRNRQASLWWCNARMTATGFYEKLGLSTYGERFEIEGIGPHKVMVKHLTKQ